MGTDKKNIKLHIVTDIKLYTEKNNMNYEGWNKYIKNIITTSGGSCDNVSLIGLKDGAFWSDPNHANAVRLTSLEAKTIAVAMDTGDDTSFHFDGVFIGETRYQFIKRFENTIFAKRMGIGSITIQKSKTCVVIAHTSEGKQQGSTNKAVD